MTDIIKNEDIKKLLEYISNKYINRNVDKKDYLFKELYDFEQDTMTTMMKRIMFEEFKGTTPYTNLTDNEYSYIQTMLLYNNIIYDISNKIINFINDNISTYKRIFSSLNIIKILGGEKNAPPYFLLEEDTFTIYCPLLPSNITEIVVEFSNPALKTINTENITYDIINQTELINNLIYNNIITMFIIDDEKFVMNNLIKKIFSNFIINYTFSSYNKYKLISEDYINNNITFDDYSGQITVINDMIYKYNSDNFNFSKLNKEDNLYIYKANLKIIDNYIILDNIFDIDDNKFNLINNKIYDTNLLNYHIIINNIQFDIEKANIDNSNNLIHIELINISNNKKLLLLNNKEVKNILLRKRNINTIRDSYKTLGTKINISNENIRESQRKIKNLEKIYNTKKQLIRDINIRYYINIAVYSFISIVYLYIHLFSSDRPFKINISLLILIIIIILVIANYMLRIKSTERFSLEATPGTMYSTSDESSDTDENLVSMLTSALENSSVTENLFNALTSVLENTETVDTVATPQISSLETPPDVQKNDMIKENKKKIDVSILSFLNSVKYYLDNIDNIEIYSILYNSLISENAKYDIYSKEYKNKKISSEGTIEIIKHDIIKKSAIIVMFSIFFLIFAISYIIYLIYPVTLKLLLVISGFIFLVNLAYFIIIIREPVRTKSKNNYWTKPPSDTLTKSNQ